MGGEIWLAIDNLFPPSSFIRPINIRNLKLNPALWVNMWWKFIDYLLHPDISILIDIGRKYSIILHYFNFKFESKIRWKFFLYRFFFFVTSGASFIYYTVLFNRFYMSHYICHGFQDEFSFTRFQFTYSTYSTKVGDLWRYFLGIKLILVS